jgi:hypothetical protein
MDFDCWGSPCCRKAKRGAARETDSSDLASSQPVQSQPALASDMTIEGTDALPSATPRRKARDIVTAENFHLQFLDASVLWEDLKQTKLHRAAQAAADAAGPGSDPTEPYLMSGGQRPPAREADGKSITSRTKSEKKSVGAAAQVRTLNRSSTSLSSRSPLDPVVGATRAEETISPYGEDSESEDYVRHISAVIAYNPEEMYRDLVDDEGDAAPSCEESQADSCKATAPEGDDEELGSETSSDSFRSISISPPNEKSEQATVPMTS